MNLLRSWARFWFTPIDPLGLTVLRVLSGLLFLVCLLPLAGQTDALFGLQGWVDRKAIIEANRLPNGPPQIFGWTIAYACTSSTSLRIAFWVSMGAIGLFTLGVATRITSVLTWVAIASFTANPALESDADVFFLLLALYLMVGHVLQGLRGEHSWLIRILGPRPLGFFSRSPGPRTSVAANVAIRMLQVNFAILLLISGLHKLQSGEWWAGVALWYQLYPALDTTFVEARAHAAGATSYLFGLSLAAYLMLGWQICFMLFAWRPGARWILWSGALIGSVSAAWLYGVPGLAPAFFLCCLSYLTEGEWQRGLAWLTRLVGLGKRAEYANEREPELVTVEGR